MLVANTLNVVLTKTIFQHGGAFQRFNCHHFGAVNIFEFVAGSNGACASRC